MYAGFQVVLEIIYQIVPFSVSDFPPMESLQFVEHNLNLPPPDSATEEVVHHQNSNKKKRAE